MDENIESGEDVILMLFRNEITKEQAIQYLSDVENITVARATEVINETFAEQPPVTDSTDVEDDTIEDLTDPFLAIYEIPYEQWQPLRNILERLQIGEEQDNDSSEWWSQPKIMMDFIKACDEVGILILFDWNSWTKGYKPSVSEYFATKPVSLIEACKYFMAIIRAERTMEGLIKSEISGGTIEKLLQQMMAELEYRLNHITVKK